MSWLSSFFDPPASQVQLPQFNYAPNPVSGYPTMPYMPSMPSLGATPSVPGMPGGLPTPYAPTGIGGAESSLLGGIGNLGGFNLYSSYLPTAQGVGNSLISDPNSSYYTQGAGTAMGLGENAALGAFNAGGGLYGLGGSIANTAFDPQSDLYNRTLQQVTDQTRAGQAARGIAMTPYGAGLEADQLRNFNIDWQNNQLQRQIAGGQAAGSLFGQGAGMQAAAPGQYLGASALPYQTSQTIGQNQLGALSTLGQFGAAGGQQAQQPISDYLNYLGWGTGQQGLGLQGYQLGAQTPLNYFNANLGAYNAGAGNALNYYNASAQTPLNYYNAALGGQGQQFGQNFQTWQGQNQLAQQAFANQMNQSNQAFNQQNQMFGGLGKALGWAFPSASSVGSFFNSPSSYFGFG